MKAVIKILALLFLMSFSTEAQWFWQNPYPQGNRLHSVKFIDANIGWAVGDCGTIIRTTNGNNLEFTNKRNNSLTL